MQRPVMNSKEKVDELILHVYYGEEKSEFDFYEDDGSTFGFQSGDYAIRSITYDPQQKQLHIKRQQGSFVSQLKKVKLVLHGFQNLASVNVDGKTMACTTQQHSFFTPLEKYDPINEPDSMGEERIQMSQFEYSSNDVIIGW